MTTILDEQMEDCILMDKVRVSDGEGGYITQWTEGAHIMACIAFKDSSVMRIAEALGNKSSYVIFTPGTAILDFHDVVKRVADGKYFRVTSDGEDMKQPKRSSLRYLQVTAEEWTLS